MKKLYGEFKEFAVKGNPFEMAFAVVVGTSFGLVVNSITKDICMPFFGYVTQGVNFQDLKYVLQEAYVNEAGQQVVEISILYGKTIQAFITFLIISITIFFTIRTFNAIKRMGEDPEDNHVPTPKNIELMQKQLKALERIEKKLDEQRGK